MIKKNYKYLYGIGFTAFTIENINYKTFNISIDKNLKIKNCPSAGLRAKRAVLR